MRLVKSDKDRRFLNPWSGFPSVFDEDFFSDFMTVPQTRGMNMWEDEGYVHVEMALPGMKEKDIDVKIENGSLAVRATKEEEEKKKEKKKVYASSLRANFFYSTTLPGNVDSSSVDAELKDGVLTVKIAKSEESKPKKIQVKSAA